MALSFYQLLPLIPCSAIGFKSNIGKESDYKMNVEDSETPLPCGALSAMLKGDHRSQADGGTDDQLGVFLGSLVWSTYDRILASILCCPGTMIFILFLFLKICHLHRN